MTEELNQVMKVRREKLDLLREKGIEPFAYRFSRTHESRTGPGPASRGRKTPGPWTRAGSALRCAWPGA